MQNSFGRDSELYIKTRVADGVTVLEDSFFTAPFKIAKPLYDDTGRIMNVIIMSASAGIMEGDRYKINVDLGKGSKMILCGQSYAKIHRMKEGQASQYNRFHIGEGALLDFVPRPAIPFGGSRFHSALECRVEKGALFMYSEILACGREKSGESFAFGEYGNTIKIYYRDELIFLENQYLCPQLQNLAGMGFFEGYTHQATFSCFYDLMDEAMCNRMYGVLESFNGIEAGLTMTHKYGVVARILGNSSDSLERIIDALRDLVQGDGRPC